MGRGNPNWIRAAKERARWRCETSKDPSSASEDCSSRRFLASPSRSSSSASPVLDEESSVLAR